MELQTDAQKIAAANPDSVASQQMLRDCNDAQEKFTVLFAISKVSKFKCRNIVRSTSDDIIHVK